MKLDYCLTHLINNHKVNGSVEYQYVGSTVWFSKQELCDEIGNYLGIDIPIKTRVSVTREQMENTYKVLKQNKNIIGTYGDEFLNDFLDELI